MSEEHSSRRLSRFPNPLRVIGRLDGNHLADLTVENLLHCFAARAVVAPAESVDQGEILGLGVLAGLKEGAQAGPINGHRLLHESVNALLHGTRQMKRPEVRGRGQENEIDLIDDVLVAVKSGVLAILGNVDPRGSFSPFEERQRIIESIRERVGHRD